MNHERPLPHVARYRDLTVYRKARRLAADVFQITKAFPREEMYSLTDQFRRSSRAIGSQIAEAWGKRRYPGHFISKLTDADAEQYETDHWVNIARDCGYVDEITETRLHDDLAEIGRMLNGMMAKAGAFCGEGRGGVNSAESEQ